MSCTNGCSFGTGASCGVEYVFIGYSLWNQDVMEELEGCQINGKKKERFAGLKSAMNRLEYDDAIQILTEWLND